MKKNTFLLLIMLFVLVTVKAEVTLLSGTGVSNDPYLIGTADDLKFMRDQVNAATAGYPAAFYKLTGNIDLSGGDWSPIGTTDNNFKGSINGNGMKVTHLQIGVSGTPTSILNAGLFAYVTDAIILNLNVETDGIYASGVSNTGILVASATGTIISNCNVTGVISTTHTATGSVGGLIGRSFGSKIVNCMADVSLTANASAGTLNCGGIAGNLSTGTFQTTANVNSYIYNSYSKTSVYSITTNTTIYAGGIVGNLAGGNIYNSYTSTSVKGECTSGVTNVYVGGIIGVGTAGLDVKNCIALNSSLICINPGANRQIGRMAGATVGTAINYDADYALDAMTVQTGTSESNLANVNLGTKAITNKQGADLGSNVPKDLLNAYLTSTTAPSGTSWLNWETANGVNNNYPYLVAGNLTTQIQIPANNIKFHSSNGSLFISGFDSGESVSIYNTNGIIVWVGYADAKTAQIKLPKGLYILGKYKILLMNY